MKHQIKPNLWFDGNAEEAARFYCDVFDDARIVTTTHYNEAGPGEPGTVMTVEWEIDGQRYVGINGGGQFTFSEAVSFLIECDTQEEIDRYWDALTDGGEEGPCGWCRDRFGLSWQVAPAGFEEILNDPDPERGKRAMQAMFAMKKFDIAEIRRAADGVPAA
jgi:predicted 3-demethylubiquinone-9 3-methyltransferase (glyoxalase superfamily)